MKLSQYINKKQMMPSMLEKKRSLNHTQTSIQKSAKYLEDSLKKRISNDQEQKMILQNKRIKSSNSLTIFKLEDNKFKDKIQTRRENCNTSENKKYLTNFQQILENQNLGRAQSSHQINSHQDIIKKKMQQSLEIESKRLFNVKAFSNKNDIKSKIQQILKTQRKQIANSKIQASNRKLIIDRTNHKKQEIQFNQIQKYEQHTVKKQGQINRIQEHQTTKKLKLKSNSTLQNKQNIKLLKIQTSQQKFLNKERSSKQMNQNNMLHQSNRKSSIQISELFLSNQSIEKIKLDSKYLNTKKSDLESKYQRFLDKLNMIGETIGHGSKSLKDIKNLNWILPSYFLYKNFYHLRQLVKIKCIQQLKKNRLRLEFINEIVAENQRIKQSLLKMKKCCEIKYRSYQNILNKIQKPLEQGSTQYLHEAIGIYIQECSNIQFNPENKKIFFNLLELINSALIIKSIEKKSVKYLDPAQLIAARSSQKLKWILQEKMEEFKKINS